MFSRIEVFTEDFLPRDLPGREAQLDTLSEVLEPATQGQPAESCWEIGPPGAGKTSTARYLLEELRVDYGIHSTRVECVGSSRWQILKEIAADHPSVPQHNGMGVSELLDTLEKFADAPYVIILDEFDGLEDPDVLIDLDSLELASLICIGHSWEDAMRLVPETLDHLFDAPRVRFESYNVDALLEILRARAETGLRPGVVDDDQLRRIADEAAGSARLGVQSLRSAAELADERGHTEITDTDIEDCVEHAHERIREQLLASLSRQHHIVYNVIQEGDDPGLAPRQIVSRYRKRSENPRSKQMVRNYRRKLERYGLVDCEGHSKWDHWWAVDKTLRAPLREPEPA